MLLRSEQTGELMAALAKAQGEFPPIVKGTVNYYGKKYAELDAIVDAIRPALSKNGIAFYHALESDLERRTASVTTYLQLGEQWIANFAEASAVSFSWDKDSRERIERFDTQTISIVWTYFKRTTLQGVTGVAAEEDEDAQSLVGNNKPTPSKYQAQVQQIKPVQQPQTEAYKGKFLLEKNGLVTCVLLNVSERTSRTGKPIVAVKFNGDIPFSTGEFTNGASTFDTGLFDALKAGLNKEVEFSYRPDKEEKYINITDVFSVDGVEYVNGKPNADNSPEFNQEEGQ